MSNKGTLRIDGDGEIDALLAKLPVLVVSKGGPTDKAMRKAGAIVRTRARQIAPDSRKTGTRDKQSAKSKAIWQNKLKNNIKSKLVKYPTTSVAIVGATTDANQAHSMQEIPRKHVLWGTSRTRQYRIARNWITKAADETKAQQDAAIGQALREEIDKHMKG